MRLVPVDTITPLVRLHAVALFILLHIACVLPLSAIAQETGPTEEPFATWEETAAQAQKALEERTATTQALEELRARLADQRTQAFDITQKGSVELRALEAQLEALGPQPEDGQTESEELASRRVELNEAIGVAQRPNLSAREAYERADVLISELDKLIREQTTNRLMRQSPSPLLPTRWLPAINELGDYGGRIVADIERSHAGSTDRDATGQSVPAGVVLLLLGLTILLILQPVAERRFRRSTSSARRPWQKLSSAVSRNLCFALLPALATGALLLGLGALTGPLHSAKTLWQAAPSIALMLIVSHWVGHSLFDTVESRRRFLQLDDVAARRAVRLCQALGLVLALETAFEAAERGYFFSPATVSVIGGALILFGSLLLFGFARLILKSLQQGGEARSGEASEGKSEEGFTRLVARLMQVSAILAVVFSAIGYVALAREALFPMILSLAIIGFAIFLYRLIMAMVGILTTGHVPDPDDDSASLIPVAVVLVLALAVSPLIALAWGARPADIAEIWRLLVEGVEFGETRISMEGLIKLVVVFAVGLVATRWLQKILRTTVLPRTRLDSGGRTALVTGLGYIGLTITSLAAVSAAGLDLSNLAVVAGALSVGIGFGMQTIVSNFVSGIILLVERPIKEGDWIEVAGYSGFVRKIAVRSTRVETFDRHDVIVPNSELIAGIVKNMTLSSQVGRLIIPVGVAYGSDLERTMQILKEVATSHPMVLRDPEPQVLFMGLGESSLDFELRCMLRDIGATLSARSEMLFQVYVELGKAGIEIPFPQRDINLRNIDKLVAAIERRPGRNVPPSADETVTAAK